jgi:lipid A ethanolaminephosphotransferase
MNRWVVDRKILYALYFGFCLNFPFWIKVVGGLSFDGFSDYLCLASLAVVMASVFYLFFNLVLFLRTEKIILGTLAVLTIFASYAVFNFKIRIDREMMGSVLHTDLWESVELISWGLIGWLVVLGGIPLVLIYGVTTDKRLTVKTRGKRLGAALGLILGAVLVSYSSLMVHHRNDKSTLKMVMPFNIFYYLARSYHPSFSAQATGSLLPLGLDAQRGALWQGVTKKTVLVIVVGEAARASHFSLNGYGRETNPLLKTKSVISLKKVSSCGTSTAVSVPGMFSRLPRERYTPERAAAEENLLDILVRAHFDVVWLDNNSDSKGVARRVPEHQFRFQRQRDEILLTHLQEELQRLQQVNHDGVIVLHQLGSHGPAYYQRYPEEFNKFKPGCDTNEIQKCPVASLINTYDNTILYTDYILARVIDILDHHQEFDTAMIYVADHGESLGEYGLYLHGAPYRIAPKEQTHVPWILWFSRGFVQDFKVDLTALRQRAEQDQFSHDYLFHSVLGVLDIQTKEYEERLNLFTQTRETQEAAGP